MPKLSIITINYNNLEGLKRTVESVVNQTWQEFEYIIIDGGSTDGSAAYIESQNEHFDYWVSEPDKGIYNAMNKGIAKATGEYFLFLNSGDHLYDLKVLEQNHSKINEQDIIYFNLNVVDENNSFIKEYPNKLTFSYFINDTLPHPATFIKSSLFGIVGIYDKNLKIVSDWKFFIESICKYNSTYLKIDKTLSTFYLDGLSSKLQNKEIIFREKEEVLRLNFLSYLVDISELTDSKKILSNLRKSRKIQVLIKLGLLNKF
ncbi:MAG: hypothetical protein RL308_3320 [Bacteroidota bacterium]|jgi:glycosyltransferase involved in cell wall biosynthesis